MKIEMEMPEIEGYEYTGEQREPKADEYFLDLDGRPFRRLSFIPEDEEDKYIILRKLKPKREFKDGAFYPVIISSVEVVRRYDSESNEFDAVRADYEGLSWIGEELVIECVEG